MKTSNRLLLLLLPAILIAAISLSFFLAPLRSGPIRKPVKVDDRIFRHWKKDSLVGAYHYVWTNFPEVELDPLEEGVVKKLAYQDAAGRVSLEIRNDTLFVRQRPAPDPEVFMDWELQLRDTTTQIIVGARGLKGLEAVDRGRIYHFGAERTAGRMAKINEDLPVNLHPLKSDELEIKLQRGGDAVLNVDANVVRIALSGEAEWRPYSRLRLRGNFRTLYLTHRGNQVDVKTHNVEADTVFVDTESASLGPDILLRVYAKEYLHARIKGRADVLYLGYPHIRKQEFHQGRLIDGNRYK